MCDLDKYAWLPLLITVIFLILAPIWIVLSSRNEYVRDVLIHGWYAERLEGKVSSFVAFQVACRCGDAHLQVEALGFRYRSYEGCVDVVRAV